MHLFRAAMPKMEVVGGVDEDEIGAQRVLIGPVLRRDEGYC